VGLSTGETDVYHVVSRKEQFSGRVIELVSDEVTMPGGRTAIRDYLRHPGACGVVPLALAGEAAPDLAGAVVGPDGALRPSDGEPPDVDRVLLVRQFRHPVRRELWELPAGLLDVAGESAVASAARELAEETDLRAGRYEVLIDLLTTPGCSDEAIRLFLARDLTPIPLAERHEREGEEATMTTAWIPLDTAVAMVFSGEIENAACAAGILATAAARAAGWQGLRPADAPWPSRPGR
jgi:8-oxo-dGTP pyrophosphatase MutT (NUDIX family)